jgi:hypothetical protein
MKKPVCSFEDLDVFQRSYRISLAVHRQSLTFPQDRAVGARRAGSPGVEIDSGQHCRGVRQAEHLARRVQALFVDGAGLGGRDAGLVAILLRPWLYRRGDLEALARRVSGARADAERVALEERRFDQRAAEAFFC